MWMVGTASILIFMTLLWVIFYKRTNAGLVDIGWALSFAIAGTVAILMSDVDGLKKVLFALIVYPWSLRLAYHLYSRFDANVEDPRYTKLKGRWGEDKNGYKFLAMFLFQGLLASIMAIPFYVIMSDPDMGLLIPGFIIVTIGWIGEAIADYQLKLFKENQSNRGRILDQGLWGLSRHPNYFFEWIVWVGFTFSAILSGYGYLSLISLGLISYLLMGLSGVRMTEEHLDESKGKDWQEYKRRVPPFFPRFNF